MGGGALTLVLVPHLVEQVLQVGCVRLGAEQRGQAAGQTHLGLHAAQTVNT